MNKDFNETANGIIEALYDFALCRRPDNSIYGIADGTQCRKGTPTQADEEISREDATAGLRSAVGENLFKKASPLIEKLNDEEFSSVSNKMAVIISNGRVQAGAISGEEITAMKANAKKLLAADEDPRAITGPLRKVSDAELAAFETLMGGATSWGGAGSASAYLQEDGTLGKGSEWRGRQVLKRYLEQDGKDAYTGLPVSIRDCALEHIQPKRGGLDNAERVENWAWIRGDINDLKEGLSMRDFLDKHVNSVSNVKAQQELFEAKRNSFINRMSFDQDRLEDQAVAGRTVKEYGSKIGTIITNMKAPNGNKLTVTIDGPTKFGSTPTNITVPGRKKKINVQTWVLAHWANANTAQRNQLQAVLNNAKQSMKKVGKGTERDKLKAKLVRELEAINIPPPTSSFWEAALAK